MGLVQHNVNWIVSQNSILQDCKSERQLHEKIIFIEKQNLNRPHLSLENVDIYRLKQAPYQSFMKIQRVIIDQLSKTFQQNSPKLIEFSSILSKLSQIISHKNLAPVQFIKINQENNLCMKTVKIDYYAAYYGIELRDVIENKKSQDCRFEQGEILYVAKSLINFGAYLQSKPHITLGHKISFGMYKSKNIFMNDNGYVKMYLFHILPENGHINYFNLLSSQKVSNLSLNLPIAPECFHGLQQNNFTPSFDFYKADLFEIGMILVDMMVESSLQRYYRFGKDGMFFEQGKLFKDLQELKQKEVYHPKIIHFLQNILQTNPQERWNFSWADKYLDDLKTECQFAYRLNLRNEHEQQNDQSTLKNKMSFKSQEPESQSVLRSIQNSLQSKLNPLPLKSLSKPSTKHSTQQPNYFHKKQSHSKQPSTHKSIYTKRRNTGVSIISQSFHQNDRSFSRKDQKSSKFTTVRNSRVHQNAAMKSQKNEKEELADFVDKISISRNVISNQLSNNNFKHKNSENWLTLGSTRINEENNGALNLLPPKSSKSVRPNLKLNLHLNSKESTQYTTKKQQAPSHISTHIKLHKKPLISSRSKDLQIKTSKIEDKQEMKESISNWRQQKQLNQKPSKETKPKLKINHLFRG